jgi:hypothetical protein
MGGRWSRRGDRSAACRAAPPSPPCTRTDAGAPRARGTRPTRRRWTTGHAQRGGWGMAGGSPGQATAGPQRGGRGCAPYRTAQPHRGVLTSSSSPPASSSASPPLACSCGPAGGGEGRFAAGRAAAGGQHSMSGVDGHGLDPSSNRQAEPSGWTRASSSAAWPQSRARPEQRGSPRSRRAPTH